MKEYILPPDHAQAMLNQLMNRFHKELVEAKLEVGILIENTYEDDELVPGLELHGMSCAATISKIPAKRRLHVPYDAEILIDGFWWDSHDDAERAAVIDHELEHIKLMKKNEKVIIDIEGRPKFKLKKDELYYTGFLSIVERHGMNSTEAKNALKAAEQVQEALKLHKERATTLGEMTFTVELIPGDAQESASTAEDPAELVPA